MKRLWLYMVAGMLFLAGCSGIRVAQDYDPQSDFGGLATYRWASVNQAPTGDIRLDSPLRDERTRAAVDRWLREKGFIKVTEGNPTFIVRYRYTLSKKLDSSGTSGSIGFGVASHRRFGGVALGAGDGVREVYIESLTLDFMKGSALLWRGTGEQRYTEYKDPKKSIRSTNALVEKILAQFPPE